jgi:hypothetical protein
MTDNNDLNRTSRTPGTLVRTVVFLVAALAALPALTGDQEMKCYSDGYDRDGDGWAGLSEEDAKGAYKMFTFSGKLRLHCPEGYVKLIGDCNDRDPMVHPRASEVGFNGHDDDCDGVIDEPTFSPARMSTDSAFWFNVAINSQDLLDHADSLFVQASYVSLADSATVRQTSRFAVHPSDRRKTVLVSVSGLDPLTLYRAQVAFFTRDAGGVYQPIGPTLGSDDWYYAITYGSDTESRARFALVQRGFEQLRDSNVGLVGYRGAVDRDGTRYGAARNEAWCTEFYVWVTKPNLRGMAGRDKWDQMIDYFRNAHSYIDPPRLTDALPADYLVMDSDGDGKKNHSGMFLAYEAAKGRAWTLEGNSGNAVRVRTRKAEIRGIGHLTGDLLRNVPNPPPPAVGIVMPDKCKAIKASIASLEHDKERFQARLEGASPNGKAQLMARITEIEDRITEARAEYRRCLDDAKREQR